MTDRDRGRNGDRGREGGRGERGRGGKREKEREGAGSPSATNFGITVRKCAQRQGDIRTSREQTERRTDRQMLFSHTCLSHGKQIQGMCLLGTPFVVVGLFYISIERLFTRPLLAYPTPNPLIL